MNIMTLSKMWKSYQRLTSNCAINPTKLNITQEEEILEPKLLYVLLKDFYLAKKAGIPFKKLMSILKNGIIMNLKLHSFINLKRMVKYTAQFFV